ncbi:MAG: preprotein translocase subunit SecG [Steroidobacteraceae bacterium]
MNWLHTATIVFHVLIAAAIVGLVLLQRGKGADAGAGFGAGASGTVFGARGSASFLSRMTATLAALFFASSLTLAYLGGRKPAAPQSVIDRVSVPQTQEAPPAPTTQTAPPVSTDQPVEAPQPSGNNAPNDAQTGQPPQQ